MNMHLLVCFCLVGEAIRDFFTTLDNNFKGVRRSVKMHILEHHMQEWIGSHHAGCGLMGEQGAESIHSQFNSLGSIYKTFLAPLRGWSASCKHLASRAQPLQSKKKAKICMEIRPRSMSSPQILEYMHVPSNSCVNTLSEYAVAGDHAKTYNILKAHNF